MNSSKHFVDTQDFVSRTLLLWLAAAGVDRFELGQLFLLSSAYVLSAGIAPRLHGFPLLIFT